jgi:hypothetical protein
MEVLRECMLALTQMLFDSVPVSIMPVDAR